MFPGRFPGWAVFLSWTDEVPIVNFFPDRMHMISPAQIRKAGLSLLYALMENGATTDAFDFDAYWEIGMETQRDRLHHSQAKAVLHCLRRQSDSLRLLHERAQKVQDALHGDGTATKLADQLSRYVDYSDRLDASLGALQYCVADKRREGTVQLALCSRDVMVLAATIVELSDELVSAFGDWPAYRSVLAPIEPVMRRRLKALRECADLRYPEVIRENPQYAALAELESLVRELPVEVNRYVREVYAARETFEAQMASVLQHYSMERLAVVDKCILYIALYELSQGLKVQIVVSEATDLAHAYSGSKSARFIHGIIAAIAAKDAS